jgi:vacuolar-type H+-ATPase subunit H
LADNGMKNLVKGLLTAPPMLGDHREQIDGQPDPRREHQALQVLTLAQRTADDHIATAREQAEKICGDARANAEQIIHDAQAHAQVLHQKAEKALSDAHTTAAQIARDARTRADAAQRKSEEILAEAKQRATELDEKAQTNAAELKVQAQQRYDDVVGSLAMKREALQRQIEALEHFDRDYRTRLTTFMQTQLRALWVDEPEVSPEAIAQPEAEPQTAPAPVPSPARRSGRSSRLSDADAVA